MKKNIHIGKLIKKRMLEQELSVSDFAIAINRTRATVYDIFERKSIDVELLLSISDILQFDFLSVYSSDISTTLCPSVSQEKYIVVKVVDKQELEDESNVIFRYKLKL